MAPAEKIRAGTVWINCSNVFDAALPFGGHLGGEVVLRRIPTELIV